MTATNTNKKIAIIGAGIMGLSTAHYLIKQGYEVTIFERNACIGGMAQHFDFNGFNIERYYHFHCTSDYDYFELLKEFKLEENLKWVNTKMGYWFDGKLQSWGDPISLLKFKGISLFAKFRYALHAFFSVKRNKYDDLDKLESISWIKKWVGEEAYKKLWKKLFDLKFYEFSDNLSAAWIWSRIRRIGRSRESMFKEKLGYLEGGTNRLFKALEQEILSKNSNIVTNAKVSIIKRTENGKYIVSLANTTESTQNENFGEFDKVVSTIPLPYVANIFKDELPKDAYDKFTKVNNIGVVCCMVELSKPLTKNFWLNVNDDNMDIPGIIEFSNLNPCNGRHILFVPYYMPTTNPKYKDSDEVYKDKISGFIKTINPEIKDSDILAFAASRYDCAQPICQPEYLKSIPELKINNDIYIADTSYYYPEDRGISEGIKISKQIAKMIDEAK